MNDYISRDAALDALDLCDWFRDSSFANGEQFLNATSAKKRIREIEAADVAPVRRGTWSIAIGYDPKRVVMCSECQRMAYEPSAFCPHCGAKMDGGAIGDPMEDE